MDMAQEEWKARLRAEIAQSGKTKRAISLEAGLGTHWLTQTLAGDISPSVDKLQSVCDVLKVSITFILTGVRMTPMEEEFLSLSERLPEEELALFLQLLRRRSGGEA